MDFKDISSEEWREYQFEGFTVKIYEPILLNVSSNGHRVLDNGGVSHYIPNGWFEIRWKSKEGHPPFVF